MICGCDMQILPASNAYDRGHNDPLLELDLNLLV